MITNRPETDIEFDATPVTGAHTQRSAECYCSRATLDDLPSDDVMAPVLRSAAYEPDEFREMMTEMAWNRLNRGRVGDDKYLTLARSDWTVRRRRAAWHHAARRGIAGLDRKGPHFDFDGLEA